MSRTALVSTLALLTGLLVPVVSAEEACTGQVTIKDNRFNPQECAVERTATVTWAALEGGHTVTADLGEFDCGAMQAGQGCSWQTPDEDRYVYYYCRVHGTPGDGTSPGRGMVGWITVGSPPPPPTPPPPPPPPPVLRVPDEFPTLHEALRAVEPGRVIELAAGTHLLDATAVVSIPGVTIRGEEVAAPQDVVVTARKAATEVGISVVADDVRLENLSLPGFRVAGVSVVDSERFALERVRLTGAGDYGVQIEGGRGSLLREVYAGGKRRAGLAVAGCLDCDLLVDRSLLEGNFVGFQATNAGAVHVLRSTIRSNATGIVVRGAATDDAPQRGSHIWGNEISDNDATGVLGPGLFAQSSDPAPPAGAGVWVAGGWENVIEGNEIGGQRYGVLITALAGPSVGNRVRGNVLGGHEKADLAYDGMGAGNCFASNRHGTSDPPMAEALYDCGLPVTVGVPNPALTADPVLHAWGTRWCRDVGACV